MIRRVLAGIILVALMAAVPAQAAGLGRPAAAPDAWTLAWSWLVRLWTGETPESQAPQRATETLQKQLPVGDSGTDSSGDQTDPDGDKGMGIDPDG